MSELSPPPPKQPLEKGFWVVLFLPLALLVVTMSFAKSSAVAIPLIALGLAVLICPLYCGIRLALQWGNTPGARILLGLFLSLGLVFVYLAVSFAGCVSLL